MNRIIKLVPYLLFLVCLGVLVLFVLLGTYAHPSSDDFCLASGINREGLFNYLWKHYLEWSGRYSANALYGVYPLIFGLFEGYRFIPLILIFLLFSATAFFLSNLFRISFTAAPVILSALAFVCIFILGMMSVASGLYWMAGALTYQSANILFLIALGLSIRLLDQQEHLKPYFWTFSMLLGVIIFAMGTNETSMLALTSVIILIFIIQLRAGRLQSRPWFIILLITLICFGIVFFSPGNAIRAADFPMRHDLARAINGSLAMGTRVLWSWISHPLLLTSSILAPFAISRLYQLSDRTFSISKSLIATLAFCTLILPILMQFPAWWAMGGWPPPRTIDAIYFLFLLSWFITIGAITIYPGDKNTLNSGKVLSPSHAPVLTGVASVMFILSVVNSPNSRLAWDDLWHHAKAYDDYMNARYTLINHALARQKLSLLVPDYYQQYPRSIYFNDIMHNSRHWRNACYADYFGLQRIKRGI